MKFPQQSTIQTISEKVGGDGKYKDPGRWRDLSAYWLLGLCNNYGYVVMLSAAHDIISRLSPTDNTHTEHAENERICQIMSTVDVRVFLACFTQCAGFLMVAYADQDWMALSGVALTSFSSGLGEVTFLAHSSSFHKNVVSTWSSGTGGAGIFGSFSYAALITLGVTPVNTMLLMLSVPLLEGAVFWILLRHPDTIPKRNSVPEFKSAADDQECGVEMKDTKLTLVEKLRYMPTLLKYMIPLPSVYLFEYFINQGLFELIDFRNIFLNHDEQYRWLQVVYQIGVFISRSSVNLVKINQVWIMSVFQLINVGIFLGEVMTFFTPSIWIIFAFVLWEGLLGGGAYVNTYYRMSNDIPEKYRAYAIAVVCMSDSIGIVIAGALAIPTHNALCKTPLPIRS